MGAGAECRWTARSKSPEAGICVSNRAARQSPSYNASVPPTSVSMRNTTSFASGRTLDVVCLGRFGVDFYAQQIGARLEDVTSFAKYLGGSSANTAFGCARLGLQRRSDLARRRRRDGALPGRDDRARRLRRRATSASIPRASPRAVVLGIKDKDTFPLIFLRENCADMAIADDDDRGGVHRAKPRAADHRHALLDRRTSTASAIARSTARAATTCARCSTSTTGPVLWGLTKRGDGETRFIALGRRHRAPAADPAAVRPRDRHDRGVQHRRRQHRHHGSRSRAVRAATRATLVVKRGPMGCAVIDGAIPALARRRVQRQGRRGRGAERARRRRRVLGRASCRAGCAARTTTRCARYANACGALVVSRHGCAPAMPTRVELDYFIANAERIPRPDQDATLTRLHRVTAPRTPRDELFVFAFDHRNQFFELAQQRGRRRGARLPTLKQLLVDAVAETERRARLRGRVGILCDDRYGQDALNAATGRGWWIGRPVELPGSNPLRVRPRALDRHDADRAGRPSTSSSASCSSIPTTTIDIRLEQEAQMRALYDAVQASGHELLLEIIPPQVAAARAGHRAARAEAPLQPRHLSRVVEARADGRGAVARARRADRRARSVLPRRRAARPQRAASKRSRRASATRAASASCRGFAVGRTIFHEPARAVARRRRSTTRARSARARANFEALIDAWRDDARARREADGDHDD